MIERAENREAASTAAKALAMHNASARLVLFCAALTFSGSIFLAMELEAPYSGVLRVSGEPLLQAAAELALPPGP